MEIVVPLDDFFLSDLESRIESGPIVELKENGQYRQFLTEETVDRINDLKIEILGGGITPRL